MLFSTLLFLLGLTHAIPAPSILPVPDPVPTRPPCITLPVILTGLPYEFTLIAQSSADPTIDGSTISFSSTGRDSYTASFGPPGQVQNVTFQNSQLSLKDGALVAGTKVPRKTLWRQVGFGPKGSGLGELSVSGSYGCHPKTGTSQLEIHPGSVSGGSSDRLREYRHQLLSPEPTILVYEVGAMRLRWIVKANWEVVEFCAGRDLISWFPTLAVKSIKEKDETCKPVTLVVTDGIRPL